MASRVQREAAPPSGATGSGGRAGARRVVVVLAVAVVVLVQTAAAAPTGQSSPEIDVREERGVYTVDARFTVPQPGTVAFAVLTDYDSIPRFMPDVRTSRIVDSADGRIVVEQEAVAKFMMFSKRIHLVLEVQPEARSIRFRDRCGKSFALYEGSWEIQDADGGAVIVYTLQARPSFNVPEFVLKRLLQRDARAMIARLQAEIAARGAVTGAGR